MAEITRHAGTAVYGYIVGGGYEGCSKELDATVQHEAESLKALYSRDVVIRFNTDRLSGGAWLVNSVTGFNGNCQVGICAGLQSPRGSDIRRLARTEIYIATNVKASALFDKSLADQGVNERYCWKLHNTVDDAIAWLKANVDTASILD